MSKKGNERELSFKKWGILAPWKGKGGIVINSRAETLNQKKMFKVLAGEKRCVVIANGYYEWKKDGHQKRPFYFTNEEGLIFLAAIYESNKDDESFSGVLKESFSIITVPAAKEVSHIHERMPAVLSKEEAEKWVDCSIPTEEAVQTLFKRPFDLIFHEVSEYANKTSHKGIICILPKKESTIDSFFTKKGLTNPAKEEVFKEETKKDMRGVKKEIKEEIGEEKEIKQEIQGLKHSQGHKRKKDDEGAGNKRAKGNK